MGTKYSKLWSLTQITDQDFSKSLEYLIQNKIIQIPESESTVSESESELPSWLRKNEDGGVKDYCQMKNFLKVFNG